LAGGVVREDKQRKAVAKFKEPDAIYFHPREDFDHFILKCAVCFVLHRRGKRFITEKPAAAMKVAAHSWNLQEKERYPGRNDYDVYCVEDDQPYEILLAPYRFSLAYLIRRKKEEYPPNTVFVTYSSLAPDIEYAWNEKLVPLWIFQESERGRIGETDWMGVGEVPIGWREGTMPEKLWSSPFKEFNTKDDLLKAIAERYRDIIEDWKKHRSVQAIVKTRQQQYHELIAQGVSKDAIGFVGVRSQKAIVRRIKKLRRYKLLPTSEGN
jgi:hypothetical protein